jgi:hypothetical protein
LAWCVGGQRPTKNSYRNPTKRKLQKIK